MNEIVRLNDFSKSFPGVKALQNISFDLRKGEVHCMRGKNEAGKSTLIKILCGACQPDEGGEILFDGAKVVRTLHLAQTMGIQTIYQEHILFYSLSKSPLRPEMVMGELSSGEQKQSWSRRRPENKRT